jgi:hypothetical protein
MTLLFGKTEKIYMVLFTERINNEAEPDTKKTRRKKEGKWIF